ncbi:MAG: inositol monophosphatase [Acaryochloridaceae cyanobacterium SU_2_1]|nr:inositol monophosphatase [Acaryochloridaceae cyanobacterium SU_2_1]
MKKFWTSVVTFAHTVTAQVGERLLGEFGQVQAEYKADGSLVTASDQWADQFLQRAIATSFPDHGLISEEANHHFPSQEWCWVIDPIDGTTNFTRGIPLWGISLGLLYQGVPVFGHIHFPPLNQTFHGFWSAPGQANAAYLNGVPLHTRQDPPAPDQLFSLCARSLSILQNPFPCKIRMLGSASYNLLTVATGGTIGAVEATPKLWDIAAVWPLIQAAGGAWISLEGSDLFPLIQGQDYGQIPYPTLVVSQADWVDQFLVLVSSIGKAPP